MKVLVTARSVTLCEPAMQMLRDAGLDITIHALDRALTAGELMELIPGYDALIPGLDAVTSEVIAAGAPTLKIIARNGVGYNQVDLEAARRQNVIVTYTPGQNAVSVAELAMGLMIGLARHVPAMHSGIAAGAWSRVNGIELAGKTLGIVGTGCIGSAIAKRAHAFDMKLLGMDIAPRQELTDKFGVVYTTLNDLLQTADIITLHVPSTASTRGMIDAKAFAKMKPTAYLINTARGDVVDEEAMIEALEAGKIAGAGLDTFCSEPIQNPRLRQLKNVVLTPHAGAATPEASVRTSTTAVRNVVRVLSGQPPETPVP